MNESTSPTWASSSGRCLTLNCRPFSSQSLKTCKTPQRFFRRISENFWRLITLSKAIHGMSLGTGTAPMTLHPSPGISCMEEFRLLKQPRYSGRASPTPNPDISQEPSGANNTGRKQRERLQERTPKTFEDWLKPSIAMKKGRFSTAWLQIGENGLTQSSNWHELNISKWLMMKSKDSSQSWLKWDWPPSPEDKFQRPPSTSGWDST